MSNKTIAKFYLIVISFGVGVAFFSACSDAKPVSHKVEKESNYQPPKEVGKIKSGDITESSGVAASRCQTDVFWTHNDSDKGAYIFAFKSSGEHLGTWKLPTISKDWEDIAAYKDKGGKCYLYIGDIGDNDSKFEEHAVYRIAEPIIKADDALHYQKEALQTETPEVVRFKYPDTKQNSEALLVHPVSGTIYIVTKRAVGPSAVYRVKPDLGSAEVQKAQIVAEISLPAIPNGLTTGGDISPDGRSVILCDYTQGYVFTLPESAANFDEIWSQKPEVVDLGERKQGEGVCYSVDGTSIFATSEGKRSAITEVKRK